MLTQSSTKALTLCLKTTLLLNVPTPFSAQKVWIIIRGKIVDGLFCLRDNIKKILMGQPKATQERQGWEASSEMLKGLSLFLLLWEYKLIIMWRRLWLIKQSNWLRTWESKIFGQKETQRILQTALMRRTSLRGQLQISLKNAFNPP